MKVVKFGKIVASFYSSIKKSDTLVIVAIGAPNLIDVDSLRNAEILTNAGYDVVTPEYYGFCRSEGLFTPKNSIQTLLDTKNVFKKGIIEDVYSGEKMNVSYKNFIFLGMSYGGGVVSLLPKYDNEIKNIAMFYPVTDYSTFGKRGTPEETSIDFLNAIKRGFSKIYNGLELNIWKNHFEDKTEYIPVKNLKYLNGINLFLCHGTNDTSIYFKKTSEFYNKLKIMFTENNIIYKEYNGLGHGFDTMGKGSYDMIKFFEKFK